MKHLFIYITYFFCVLLLVIEKILGIHAFFVAGIFSMFFITSPQRRIWIFLLGGLLHDAMFWLPMGTSFLLTAPFLYYYPRTSKVFKSRMVAFCIAVTISSILFLFISPHFTITPLHIILSIFSSMISTVFLYFFILNHPSFSGIVTKQSSWKFK